MSKRTPILRYLMGESTEPEQLHIEEQYFADADFLGEVQAICDELIDAYLTGTMSAADRERFERRLHAIPFLQTQVETSRALLHLATANMPTSRQPQPRTPQHFIGWQARLNALFPRLVMVGAVCGLLFGGIWYWRQGRTAPSVNPNRPNEPTIAQVIATPTPAPTIVPTVSVTPIITASPVKHPPPPILASILLSAEVTRGDAQLARLILPSVSGLVRLQLELPSEARRSYQAVLQTATGQTLRTWHKAVTIRRPPVSIVELQVPTHLLPRGQYVVTLADGTPAASYKFPFLVESQ